jgi:Flp pilus assembly protein TadB
LYIVRADRRRAAIEPHLKALTRATPAPDGLVISLRRPQTQRKALPAALAARLEIALARTGNRVRPLHLAATGIAAPMVTMLMAMAAELRPALGILFAAAAAAGAPALLIQLVKSRYQRQFLDIFPDALDLIVRAVKAGLPAPEAIELASRESRPPVGTEFARMLDELRIGTDTEDVLQRAAERIGVPDFQFFVVSLLLQRQTGGGIAETLANLSTIIRQRKALRQKARALSAEAQASAAIVATTPFIAGVGLFLVNRQLMSTLFIDPRGRFMLGLAIAGLLSGVVAMRALIQRNLR